MTALPTAIAIIFFTVAHVVRDGWPSWKDLLAGLVGTKFEWLYHLSTQLARMSGAALCAIGALFLTTPLHALYIGLAILAGFYTDMKHGEAAGVDTLTAVADSFLSGVTSVAPLTALLVYFDGWWALSFVVVGLLKPAIWWLSWRGFGWTPGTIFAWFQPTRVAAGLFGACVAAALSGMV